MKKIRERKRNENKEENFVLALIIYQTCNYPGINTA